MSLYPQAWHQLEYSPPADPTDYIAWAKLDTAVATFKRSPTYATPESGTWSGSLVVVADPAAVNYTNPTYRADINYIKDAITVQSKLSNASGAPLPLKNKVYCIGNERGRTDWITRIMLNFGLNNYDVFEMSLLDNAGTKGDAHGKYPVLDFGTGPFTGTLPLDLIFSGYFGSLNLGIHIEKSDNTLSSYLVINTIVLPVESPYFRCGMTNPHAGRYLEDITTGMSIGPAGPVGNGGGGGAPV